MRISDWSSDACSSDLAVARIRGEARPAAVIKRGAGGRDGAIRIGVRGVDDGGDFAARRRIVDRERLAVAGLHPLAVEDRKSVGEGKSVSVRVDLGGRRLIKNKKQK